MQRVAASSKGRRAILWEASSLVKAAVKVGVVQVLDRPEMWSGKGGGVAQGGGVVKREDRWVERGVKK